MRALLSPLFWLLLLVVGATKLVDWTTDFWWFQSLGAGEKWLRIMTWRTGAFGVGFLLGALIFGQNVRLALLHLRHSDFALLGGDAVLHGPSFQTLQKMARGATWVALWLAGIACANRYDLWAGLQHFQQVGKADPVSGQDLSFFLFVLPALDWGWNFFGALLLLSFFASALLYFYGELIETGPQLLRVASAASRHLMVLTALLIVWSGVRQGILALEAPIQSGGSPNEIWGQTQARLEVPLRWMLLVLAPIVAYWLVKPQALRLHSRVQLAGGWALLLFVGVPLLMPASRAFGVFTPHRETQNIERHLRTTRENWGLNPETRRFAFGQSQWQNSGASVATSSAPSTSSPSTSSLPNFEAWPEEPLRSSLQQADTSSARSIARAHFSPGKTPVWNAVAQERNVPESRGGVVLQAQASSGEPPQIVRRVRLNSLLLSEQMPDAPRGDGFWVTPSTPLQREGANRFNPQFRWAAEAENAVSADSLGRAFLLSWRFWSRAISTRGEAVSWRLDPVERARALYPFFDWSHSLATPHLIATSRGERLVWQMQGFSRSKFFPDSATLGGADSWRGINYLRPAIRLAFDAHNGALVAAQWQTDEPLARAYARAFETVPNFGTAFLNALPSPDQSAFALARASIWAHYKTEKDDAIAFGKRERAWRVWNELAPARDRNGQFLFGFAPAQSRAEAGATPTLLGVLGLSADEKPTFWRLSSPMALPEISKLPRPIDNQRRPVLPPSRFGFTIENDAQTLRLWRAVARRRGESWVLQVEEAHLGKISPAPSGIGSGGVSRVAKLWSALKTARRNGEWARVETLERELDALLLPQTRATSP